MRTPDLRSVATVRSRRSYATALPLGFVLPSWLVPVMGAVGVVLIMLVAGLGVTLRAQAGQSAQMAMLNQRLAGLATQPLTDCTSAATWLATITRQEEGGDWETAYTNAQTALTDPSLCAGDRQALAQQMLHAGTEALFAAPLSPTDESAQQSVVAGYFALTRQAREYDLPPPLTPRQAAGRAYNVQAFLLAQTALEEAMGADASPPLEDLRLYTDALYNRGAWGARREHGFLQPEGLSYLAAAWQLNERFRLGREEPAALLGALLGQERSTWPAPAPIPLLSPPTPGPDPDGAGAQ